MRRRRSVEVFTLSFLDCICCGFGAVILFYTIVSAEAGVQSRHGNDALAAQVNHLEEQVAEGSRGLVVLHNEIERTESDTATAETRTRSVEVALQSRREQLAAGEASRIARNASVQQLAADTPALPPGQRRLEAGSLDITPPGQQLTSFRDSGGDRRYITGVRLHGSRILILLDRSASMLHEDVVSVLALRNAPDEQKRAASKWRRALDTVHWLLTQLPGNSQYQIYTFNTQAQALLPDQSGRWISAKDAPLLARGLASLHALVPDAGTSLFNAFAASRVLNPLPDQIILITDGLPTQGPAAPGGQRLVTPDLRARLFDESLRQLPAGVPVDSILLPMQGDPQAPHRFWNLARLTHGTLLMPSRDWP
jgi:hypothetical protein